MTPKTDQLKDLLAMGEAGYSGAFDHLEKIAPTLAAEVVRLREALTLISDNMDLMSTGRTSLIGYTKRIARQALDATSYT